MPSWTTIDEQGRGGGVLWIVATMYPWNHLRGLSYPWMSNHGYLSGLVEGLMNGNHNVYSWNHLRGVLWMATTMNPWVHLYPWNHSSGLSYPWMSNHGYLGGGVLWMATTMYPWVTMDTFAVHNTSPADSCKLNREGTLHGAVDTQNDRSASTLLGTGTRYMQHSHNLCSWHTLEHYCWNAVGKLKYHFYFQITQLHLSHFATISRDASNMPA